MYQNRQGMAIDYDRGGLKMFENDLAEGDEIQLMRRSIDFAYMEQRVNQLYQRIEGRDPFLALYIDCAGRAGALAGTDEEEAAEIQRLVGSRMPLLGMYSAIEIAKVGDKVRPLDWTGVLCVFSQ
jgi:small ligand-binding sensory domain FIST